MASTVEGAHSRLADISQSLSLESPSPLKAKMEAVWQQVKAYFDNGNKPETSPLNFNIHLCSLQPTHTETNDSSHYGIEIAESSMPLFTILGPTIPPSCFCVALPALHNHIESYMKSSPPPTAIPTDYTIHSSKDDLNIFETSVYALRDTLQWWVHWTGSVSPTDYWKQLYIAFSTISDDLMIPPLDLVSNKFRFLNRYSLADLLAGLRQEGVAESDVLFMDHCLRRQHLLQYVEKTTTAGPGIRSLLRDNMPLSVQYRTFTANTAGAAVAVLAARGQRSDGVADIAVETAGTCDALSMDMMKEAMDLSVGEVTATVNGADRARLKAEMRWIYVRCLETLDGCPRGVLLRRFASAGLHFTPMMERYVERMRGGVRVPISKAQWGLLEPFVGAGSKDL